MANDSSTTRVDRRDFLKLIGAGSIGAGAGVLLSQSGRKPQELLVPYPEPPEDYTPGIDTWYNTLCHGCSARCGVSVRVREGRVKKIEGNAAHPVSQGGLCARGQAGVQTLYHPDRITEPLFREAGELTSVSWDRALSNLAYHLRQAVSSERGDGVFLVTGSARGHLYHLMDSFLSGMGSRHLISYRIDAQHNLHAANNRCFGFRAAPYYDIGNARYLLSFGADFLTGWLSPVHYSRAFGDMRQGEGERGHFVQIEPRLSLAAANADEWIPSLPGTEAWLALGLCRLMVEDGIYQGADRGDWELALSDYPLDQVVTATGMSEAQIRKIAHDFANADGLAIIGGSSLAGSNGLLAASAVNALNYLAGSVDRAGGVLANPGAAFGPGPGYTQSPYGGLEEVVNAARQGRIETLILHDVDPLYSAPPGLGLRQALESIPMVISMTEMMNDSSQLADYVLPMSSFLESWDDDVPESGVGFATASLAQPIVRPIHDTRSAGDVIINLAKRLGDEVADAVPWEDTQEMLKQHWQEIYRTRAGSGQGFDAFWNATLQAGVWGEQRPAGSSSKTVMVAAALEGAGNPDPQWAGRERDYPYHLQAYPGPIHHDGRWAHLPWLQEMPDPITGVVYTNWAEMHPDTAAKLGVKDRDIVELESPAGKISIPVLVYPAIHPNVIAVAMGQGHKEFGRYASGRGANPIEILVPIRDGISGDLAWASTRVRVHNTGLQADYVSTSGNPRPLGRQILGPDHGEHG